LDFPEDYQEQLASAAERIPNWDKLVEAAGDIQLPDELYMQLARLPNVVDCASLLASDPELTEKLLALPPIQQGAELARMSNDLAQLQQRVAQAQAVEDAYQDRVTQFKNVRPDFDKVVARISMDRVTGPAVEQGIMESPNGPELAYWLGSHPEVLPLIEGMRPEKAYSMVLEMSQQLAREGDIPLGPNRAAAAPVPAPIKPIRKVAATSTTLSDDDSVDVWMQKRWKQVRAQQGGQQ
jgi:hypothetical protein